MEEYQIPTNLKKKYKDKLQLRINWTEDTNKNLIRALSVNRKIKQPIEVESTAHFTEKEPMMKIIIFRTLVNI